MLEKDVTCIQEYTKSEMLKRYRYLFENKELILSLCIKEGIEEKHYKKCLKDVKKSLARLQYSNSNNKEIGIILTKLKDTYRNCLSNPRFYLMNQISPEVLGMIEEFLMSDQPLEETALYKEIEYIKSDPLELSQAEYLIESLNERRRKNDFLKNRNPFTVWRILTYVRDNNLDNEDILAFLDIFYNLDRSVTSGLSWESGYVLTDYDVANNEEYLNNIDSLTKISGVETTYASSYIVNRYLGNEFECEDNYFASDDELSINPSRKNNYCPSQFVYNAIRIESFTEEEKKKLHESLRGEAKKYTYPTE